MALPNRSTTAKVMLAVALCVVVAEVGVRVAGERLGLRTADWRAQCAREDSGEPEHYEASPHLVYRLNARPGVNSLGFSDREWIKERTPGVTRIACLGGSTTQNGFGADRVQYPRELEGILRERSGTPVEVMNWGVDGWTTAESMINLHLSVLDFDPDVVIVLHGINDVWPRVWPGFRNDYSHYRSAWRDLSMGPFERALFHASALYGLLRLRNDDSMQLASRVTREIPNRIETLNTAVLRPETALPFEENMRDIVQSVQSRGKAAVLLTMCTNPYTDWCRPEIVNLLHEGTVEHNRIVRRIAAETGSLLVDLELDWQAEFESRYLPEFKDIVHLSKRGIRMRADAVAAVLLENGVLATH